MSNTISNEEQECANWYEKDYMSRGFAAQRMYPNEEFLRFMGRNYFSLPVESRRSIDLLELGCGSCANLWMVVKEGFNAHGIDLSREAISHGRNMIDKWCGGGGDLRVASMTEIPYKDQSMDVVADIFSSYCLTEKDFETCLSEIYRVLKRGGRFFSYIPGKRSDAFQNHLPSGMLDNSTINGVHRDNSPFSGNHYPFRFVHPEQYSNLMKKMGFNVEYLETVMRSYYSRQENFEHVILEAVK